MQFIGGALFFSMLIRLKWETTAFSAGRVKKVRSGNSFCFHLFETASPQRVFFEKKDVFP
jgi:hypothetical protein